MCRLTNHPTLGGGGGARECRRWGAARGLVQPQWGSRTLNKSVVQQLAGRLGRRRLGGSAHRGESLPLTMEGATSCASFLRVDAGCVVGMGGRLVTRLSCGAAAARESASQRVVQPAYAYAQLPPHRA